MYTTHTHTFIAIQAIHFDQQTCVHNEQISNDDDDDDDDDNIYTNNNNNNSDNKKWCRN